MTEFFPVTNKHFLVAMPGYPVSGYSSVKDLLAGISLKVFELFIDVTVVIPGVLPSASLLFPAAS